MSEEEKFEEIIRRKFDEKEFVFNEENWEKAERKIDTARSKSKIFKWAAVFTIGLFTGMALMLPFIESKNAEKMAEITDISRISNPENNGAEFKKEAGKRTSEENAYAILQPEIKSESQNDENEIFNSREEPKTRTDIADIHTRLEDRVSDKLNYPTPVFQDKETAEDISTKHPVNEQKEILQLEQRKKNKVSGPRKKNGENTLSEKTELLEINNAKMNNPSVQTDADITKNSEKKDQQKNNSAPKTESISDPSADKTEAEKNTVMKTTVPADSVPALNQVEGQIATRDSVKSKTDSSSVTSQNKPVESASLRGLASANIVSLEAGTNFALGWKYNDTLEARGFTPLIGISFTHCFNPKWSLSFGIQYGSIGSLKASQKIFSHKTFDFGYNTVDTAVDTKRIYYAVLPVQLHYNFNSKNCIGIGGSFSYLLNTTSNVSIYKNNADPIQKKEIGYYEGAFKTWDASLTVLYCRRISQRVNVSLLANYGLFDIKSDAFFSRKKFERSSGLKMIITYDLFQY